MRNLVPWILGNVYNIKYIYTHYRHILYLEVANDAWTLPKTLRTHTFSTKPFRRSWYETDFCRDLRQQHKVSARVLSILSSQHCGPDSTDFKWVNNTQGGGGGINIARRMISALKCALMCDVHTHWRAAQNQLSFCEIFKRSVVKLLQFDVLTIESPLWNWVSFIRSEVTCGVCTKHHLMVLTWVAQ